ncbi:hypothetical protein [Actinophytocola xanthii]|nr:hypothetical protein [Actinophytocola xanthii]
MKTLRIGDVVLFTGKKQVRAIGEVGHSFRNALFADSLWKPHADRGSYQNVYSLLNFEPTDIGYEEIWDLPGFNSGDNFMGLRFLNPEKSAVIIDGLGIETGTSRYAISQQQRRLEVALRSGTQRIAPEAVNTERTAYSRPAATLTVRRAEALLVREYRASLDGLEVHRIRSPAGVTDLHVTSTEGVEVIEAKSGSTHFLVRQALGQLLDYVVHISEPVTRLSALFPLRPADADVALLNRYGIDCLYRTSSTTFTRLEAPASRRDHMRLAWKNPLG